MTALVQKPKVAVEAPSPKATVTCEADCSNLDLDEVGGWFVT